MPLFNGKYQKNGWYTYFLNILWTISFNSFVTCSYKTRNKFLIYINSESNLYMVSDDHMYQYFQFVKDMLLWEVIYKWTTQVKYQHQEHNLQIRTILQVCCPEIVD